MCEDATAISMLHPNAVDNYSVDEGYVYFFFFKQKTAYEIGTGDWSSDVCSSDLVWGL